MHCLLNTAYSFNPIFLLFTEGSVVSNEKLKPFYRSQRNRLETLTKETDSSGNINSNRRKWRPGSGIEELGKVGCSQAAFVLPMVTFIDCLIF